MNGVPHTRVQADMRTSDKLHTMKSNDKKEAMPNG